MYVDSAPPNRARAIGFRILRSRFWGSGLSGVRVEVGGFPQAVPTYLHVLRRDA